MGQEGTVLEKCNVYNHRGPWKESDSGGGKVAARREGVEIFTGKEDVHIYVKITPLVLGSKGPEKQ